MELESIIIFILQVVCFVLLMIAILFTRKAQRNIDEFIKNIDEGLWKYTKAMKVEMETRFKKIEAAIASLRERKKKIKK